MGEERGNFCGVQNRLWYNYRFDKTTTGSTAHFEGIV
jgi:hypothetical protein